MQPKILFCAACGEVLSAPLIIHSGKDPSVDPPVFVDRQPVVDRGNAFKSYEPLVRSYGGDRAPLEFVPQHWLNPDDLTEAVRMTKQVDRLGGCCGIAGHSGPNQLCRCGASIGTLQDDCFTSRIFIPEPDATRWEASPYA